jgi:hypothetical protein
MIAFFTITEKQLYALICTAIFVTSILYLVTTYPEVNSTNLFENEDQTFKIDDEDSLKFNQTVNSWR